MAREFRLIRGGGSITPGGLYTAPAGPEPEVEIGLFEGNVEIDTLVFGVTLPNHVSGIVPDEADDVIIADNALGTISRLTIRQTYRAAGEIALTNRLIPAGLMLNGATGYLNTVTLRCVLPSQFQFLGSLSYLEVSIAPQDLSQDTMNNLDFTSAFEERGILEFSFTAAGTKYVVPIRAKGTGVTPDTTEPYRWRLTEAENSALYAAMVLVESVPLGTFSHSTNSGRTRFYDGDWFDSGSVTLIPDVAVGTPAGTISNKIAEISEDETHQYELSGVVGGLATFVPETDGILVTIDGIVVPKEVDTTTAADSETVGVYVQGTRVDGDSFRVVAVAEAGVMSNKISELYAHQSHSYQASGVAGGAVSYRVVTGPGTVTGSTYDIADFTEITRSQTVVVEQVVGGVVTDSDTFTLFPTVARIANKVDVMTQNGHLYRAEANRAPGAITWAIDSGHAIGGSIDAQGNYAPPAAQTTQQSGRINMLLDGAVVDFDNFTIPGNAKGLAVSITNHVDSVQAGQSHTFIAMVSARNVTGPRTVTWQELYNEAEFGSVVKQTDELQGLYTAPADAGEGQGFPMGVEVIIDQDGQTASAKSFFWVAASNRLDPPTVEAFVTQDDARVIVFDPPLFFGRRTGYEVKLQRRQADNTYADVQSASASIGVPRVGSQGAGRTFANLGLGTYRGAVRAIDSVAVANNSVWVFTLPVTVTQDFPDRIPGPPPAPELTRIGDDLVIDYQDPRDDGGTHLVRARVEVYRDGTTLANRRGTASVGVRLGRQKIFYNFAIFTGTYRARVSWDNANSADSGEARNWSAMSEPLTV